MSRLEDALRKVQSNRQAAEQGPAGRTAASGNAKRLRQSADLASAARSELTAAISTVPIASAEVLSEQRIIATSLSDERVGVYRQLRTQILATMRENNWQTLGVTSAHEGAGKSLTAINLAIALSRDSTSSSILIDLDLMTPSICKKLNIDPSRGLIDYLNGQAELEEIVFDIGIEDLLVVAGLPASEYSSELVASQRMRDLLQQVVYRDQRWIGVIDLPPLLRNDDAMLFAGYADAMLLVVEDGRTTSEMLLESLRLLSSANLIGTLLNKAKQ